jgi:hypothetical protein
MFTPPARRVDKVAFGKPTHYYEDAEGRRIPGVTTILNEGLPKPALINWAGNATAEYAVNNWDSLADMGPADRLKVLKRARYEDRDAAARRGTEVHALAEQLLLGREVAVPDELRGHVESYVRFLDEVNPDPLLVEVTVVNYTHGYAGTLDMVITLPDDRRVLADIKTTRSGIYGETALQLAAYRYAEVYMSGDGLSDTMPEVDEVWGIWVRGDGYDIVPLIADQGTFDDFRRVAAVARASKRLSTYILPTLEAPAHV